jgi:ribose-phosphate pyrophosphokinase
VKIEENVRGEEVFIIQPTSPPTNHNLMELFIMIDALRRASAKRITAVLPFYGYARQDRKDQPRVPITAKLVANLLVAAGANRILTMDLHAQQIQGFFDIPVDHLYAAPVMYDYLKKKNLTNLVVVSPDVGGIQDGARVFADAGGGTGHRRQAPQKRDGSGEHGGHRRNQGQKCPAGGRFDGDGGHADSAAALLEERRARRTSWPAFPMPF